MISEKYIILVDDEMNMRNLLLYVLQRVGHAAKIFSNGRDAVDEYKKGWKDVELVITDLSMDDMTGLDVVDAILSINPKEKILLITGFFKEEIQHLVKSRNVAILTKPFTMEVLSETLDRLIKCKKERENCNDK